MAQEFSAAPSGNPAQPTDRYHITPVESSQINVARFLCIFFMVGVHIYPGTREPTILYQGALHPLWLLYIDMFGRASVATLSFIGGYILFAQSARKSTADTARNRFVTVYLPMVTWNFVKVALVFVSVLLAGGGWNALMQRLDVATLLDGLNLLFALTETPASQSLSFLRDFFVSIVIARLILPVFERAWPVILLIVFVVAAYRVAEPILLRPSILLLVLSGVLAAKQGWTLTQLSNLKAVLAISGFFAVLFVASLMIPISNPDLDRELPNLFKRLMLVPVMLGICRWLVLTYTFRNSWKLRTWVFVTYLSHGVVAQVLGEVWQATGINNHSPLYLLFFVFCTVTFFAVGYVLALIIPYLPAFAQVAISGAVRERPSSNG